MPVDARKSFATSPVSGWTAPEQIRVAIESSPLSVREGLDRIVRHPKLADLGKEEIGNLWTVLAEVLNNSVEHAYAEFPGTIQVRLWRDGRALAAEVTDRGLPLPGLRLPEGRLPAAPEQLADLPEGNFGWFLIRALTDCLTYERRDGANQFRFSIASP